MHLHRAFARRLVRTVAYCTLLVAATASSGCLPGDNGGTNPTGGTIELALSLSSARIAVGAPVSTAVTITRVGGYNGTVILSADSLPLGVTVGFDPPALSGAATASIMTITAAANAVVGDTLMTVRGTGTNLTAVKVVVPLQIASGSIAVTSVATAASTPAGSTGSIPVTVERFDGFASAINLLAEGLPANVVATFTPALLPNGTATSTLSLAAAPNATPGTSTITIRAKALGVADKTVAVPFTITAAGGAADFALAAAPAALSVVAGSAGQSNVTINRVGGFAGAVTFALTGMPAGVTGVFTPNPSSTNTAALAINTTSTAAAGTYALTVTGTAAGQTPRTIPISLTVKAVPAVTVALTPNVLSVAQGGLVQTAILLTRVGGLTGDFVMSITGLPAGVTASFTPGVIIGTSGTLALAASSTTVAGTYNVVIKASAGSDVGSATLALTVR